MALKKLQVQPGFDKQNTASGAEGKWIDGDLLDSDMASLKK